MRLLLDTHAVIWWQRDDRRLRRAARAAIASADVVYVSAATGVEAAIKINQGRMRLSEPLPASLLADDFTELPIALKHAQELERLPLHHKDPVDRMLVAQARAEGLTLVTHDRMLEKYGVPIIWT